MKKAKIAIIGGTGFEKLFISEEKLYVGTPHGIPPPISIGNIGDREVAFLPRHGSEHSVPPHKVNYRANVYALHQLGVERIIAVNAVGAINRDFKPGDIVIPHDFADFTKQRTTTFYDEAPVTHVDMSQPYCPELREKLVKCAERFGLHVWSRAVLVCTEGPRFETPAEIEMFRRLGFDVVGMTGVPEAVLARELEICYAAVCFVSNMAAGMQERLTPKEVYDISIKVQPKIEQILIETIKALPTERKGKCPCMSALKNARIK
ncbi:MAG: S-methyl-5'-thioadenosine phosphorylase [Candidatus Bathyarchaeota archaeon]|nr:S-methyl-5'-thioadenosine phosphorylase [Candidatus Bathyarchaeota archaeon]MDW8040903.1 S-methyl-5'-thioadenosine phosphorylase [Nitrososphaerota archaeon]